MASDTTVLKALAQTLTNKTLTTPVIASIYQDAGKTKLMTLPDTASDTLAAIAAAQTLTNKTLTSPVINTQITGTAVLDEDNLATDSATQVPTQQSVKAYVDSGTVTMTNKTLTTPTLTSPVLNTSVSGTAFLDEDDMASDSANKVASQQSIVAYIASRLAGAFDRSQFTYNGDTTAYTIKCKAAQYFCKDKLCYWTSELTTSAIGTPAADTWYYLYLDYSACRPPNFRREIKSRSGRARYRLSMFCRIAENSWAE